MFNQRINPAGRRREVLSGISHFKPGQTRTDHSLLLSPIRPLSTGPVNSMYGLVMYRFVCRKGNQLRSVLDFAFPNQLTFVVSKAQNSYTEIDTSALTAVGGGPPRPRRAIMGPFFMAPPIR